MTASEFVESVSTFAPSPDNFLLAGFSEDMAEELAKEYIIDSLGVSKITGNEILDLIANYDIECIEIGSVTFNKKVKETNELIIFGKLEADPLAISKKNGEIIMVDHEDLSHIMFVCAADASHFLDALLIAWQTITFFCYRNPKLRI